MRRQTSLVGWGVLVCAAATAGAQRVQSGGAPVKPATAAPQTQADPNLRTDAQPRVSLSPATDSAPAPETLGVDSTPYVEMGPDWSLPPRDTDNTVLKRIVTKKGVVHVEDVTTYGVAALPVTNPPLPPTATITHIPDPPVVVLPKPQDPLAALPQGGGAVKAP